ncbi:4915_t:CDS:2, partial [Racocetra persica]
KKKKDEKGFGTRAYGFAFGSRMLKFLFGFATINIIIPGAIIANSFITAKYLLYAIGGGNGGQFRHYGEDFGSYFDKDFLVLRFLAIFILAITTAYHILAIKKKYESYAVCIDQILVLFKYVSLFALAIIGLCKTNDKDFSDTYRDNWHKAFNNTLSPNVSYTRTVSEYIGSYGSAMIQILYSYEGWDHLKYSSEELRVESPFRKYSALVNVCITMVLSNPKISNESIAIDYGIKLFGEAGRKFVSSLIAISAFKQATFPQSYFSVSTPTSSPTTPSSTTSIQTL